MQVLTPTKDLTIEKIRKQLGEIRQSVHRETFPISEFRFLEGDRTGAQASDFDDTSWTTFQVGDTWGGYDKTAWFRTKVTIPKRLRREKMALRFLVGPRDGGHSTAETLLYVDGAPLQAIDIWHEEAWLPPELLARGELTIALKAWSGVLGVPDRRRFKVAELVRTDRTAESFYFLALTLHRTLEQLDERDWRYVRMLGSLEESFRLIDWSRPGSASYYDSLVSALESLRGDAADWQALEPEKPTVIGVGHAHIDMAWLWRLEHSREKAARTFSTALHLMRQYPEYRFMHSSPQLYRYLESDHPEIFARVKERVASGEWEVTGGMWVEPDVNLPSGESLVRQLLHGKRYIRETFGLDNRVVWLPDVFGYSSALPQILRKSGIRYFMTTKISWSQFNRFSNDTFRWRGIDGSEVLAHFITTPEEGSKAYTYNGQLEPKDVKGLWDNYRQKDVNSELLQAFGWGDGGGGPTVEMLESARAMCNLPGLPKVQLGHVEPFFERLEQRLEGKAVPVWDGELYLEYHRGTYTSQARTKRDNRKAEGLYHQAELFSSVAEILLGDGRYPDLNEGWELLLLNQFHDILPGSSIREVYEDSARDFEVINRIGRKAATLAQRRLAECALPEGGVLAFNATSFEQSGLLSLPWSDEMQEQEFVDESGETLPSQRVSEDGGERLLLLASAVPPLGYRAYDRVPVERVAVERRVTGASPALEPVGVPTPVDVARTEPIGVSTSGGSGATGRGTTGRGATGSGATGSGAVGNETVGSADLNAAVGAAPRSAASSTAQPAAMSDAGRVAAAELAAGTPPNLSAPKESAPDLSPSPLSLSSREIETPFYSIRLDARGRIERLYDKREKRSVLAPGAYGNVLQAFEDKPLNFDAWDIDVYYQEKMREVDDLVEAEVLEHGPLRGVLSLEWRFLDSVIRQRLTVYAHDPRIDFVTDIDWRESQILLKAAFPIDVRANRATFDIQFGNIERPTHWNTSWDWARFEVVGHKWADLSEGNYGVALLNDCKYGHDVKDNIMRLTLIKSAVEPDPQADKGRHRFTYALLPHHGTWREGGVVQQGYDLNLPLQAQTVAPHDPRPADPEERAPRDFSFARLSCDNIVLETLKRAEDGDGWIVRLYESKQFRTSGVRIRFGLPLAGAVECDLMEDDVGPAEYDDDELIFDMAPYEIKTFRVRFG